MKTKNYKVAFSTGYVEDSSISWVFFEPENNEHFQSKKDALKSLVDFLYKKFTYRYPVRNINGCVNCGHKPISDDGIDVEGFEDYVRSIPSETVDSFGYDDVDDGIIWNAVSFKNDAHTEVITIYEYTEKIFSRMLKEIFPENFIKNQTSWNSYIENDFKKIIKEPVDSKKKEVKVKDVAAKRKK